MIGTSTVLIIDDDAFLTEALKDFLERKGIRARTATDGLEGIALFQAEPPDLVLLDLTMPGLDGFETCQRIQALEGAADTPVIVMTAVEGWEPKVRAFRCGAVDYVVKPFHFEEVEARVGAHLAIRRQAAELRENQESLRQALASAGAMNRNLLELNQKLRRSEAIKSRFLALMRNEIINPLTSIMGLAGEVACAALPMDKVQSVADVIQDEAFRLDCQIQNVFTAAELEAGELRPEIARVDVASILEILRTSFESAARAKRVDLAFRVVSDGAPVATDGAKVRHILSNLVGNAITWGPVGGRVEILADLGESLVFRVSDGGPGLPADVRKLLEDTTPGVPGQPESMPGARLGVLVVKALVDLMGGSLRVVEDGGRCSVVVDLPQDPNLETPLDENLDGNILIFDEPQEF
jgi:DNA-binding response OmpR family regulator